MSVAKILEKLTQTIIACRPEDTIQTVATILATKGVGALPVRNEQGAMLGIISERDLVRAFADKGAESVTLRVRSVMTRDVITCSPDDSAEDARTLLRKHGFRHLPVVKHGELVGFLSIRDLLETRIEETELEVSVLKDSVIAARFR